MCCFITVPQLMIFLQILADASSSEIHVISCPVCWFSSSQQLHNADLECHLLSHVLRCAFSNTYACSRFTIRPSHNTYGRFTKPRNLSRSVVFGSSSSPPYKSMHCFIILPLCQRYLSHKYISADRLDNLLLPFCFVLYCFSF